MQLMRMRYAQEKRDNKPPIGESRARQSQIRKPEVIVYRESEILTREGFPLHIHTLHQFSLHDVVKIIIIPRYLEAVTYVTTSCKLGNMA